MCVSILSFAPTSRPYAVFKWMSLLYRMMLSMLNCYYARVVWNTKNGDLEQNTEIVISQLQ